MNVQEFYTDESKWVKGALFISDGQGNLGKACLLGALSEVYRGYKYGAALGKLRHFIHLIRPDLPHSGSVSEFNDDPKTTFADIRRVIELADL